MLPLILALLQQLPAQNFPPIDKPGVISDLGAQLDHACPRTAARDRNALLQEEKVLAQPMITGHPGAAAWLALACARARLDADGAIAHDGPDMVSGNSWGQGGQRAALEALKLAPSDSRAAEVVALLALDDDEPDNAARTLDAIRSIAMLRTAAPATLRACSELAWRAADTATALKCSAQGLARGADSTWHWLRIARLDFLRADTVAGLAAFQRAATVARDSMSRREVAWHLQWFLRPDERKTWDSVPAADAGNWIRDRLISRDVRDGQPFGGRIAEHFNRLEYVEKHFRLHVAKLWHNSIRTLPAVTESGSTPVEPDPILADSGPVPEPGSVPARMFREYNRWQSDYDDRGIVWLRYGAPDAYVNWSCPFTYCGPGKGPVERVAWKYTIDGNVLLLSFESEGFDGSTEATRLVTGVLGSYFCGFDARRCQYTSAAQEGAGHLKEFEIEQTRAADRAFISTATTTDDNSPRSTKSIGMVARYHRFWDPVSEDPIALVTYGFASHDLALDSARKGSTSVTLAFRQWDPGADKWLDTTFVTRWPTADSAKRAPTLTGFAAVTASPGVTSWSLVATQPGSHFGRTYDVQSIPLGQTDIAISDLLVGSDDAALRWRFHGANIAIAADNIIDLAAPASLYYQVRSSQERTGYRTIVALYHNGDGADTTAALQVGFEQAIHAGVNEVNPELDASRLKKGLYRLDVRIEDGAGTVVARRSGEIELR